MWWDNLIKESYGYCEIKNLMVFSDLGGEPRLLANLEIKGFPK